MYSALIKQGKPLFKKIFFKTDLVLHVGCGQVGRVGQLHRSSRPGELQPPSVASQFLSSSLMVYVFFDWILVEWWTCKGQ
jgi:hypothetical protein